MLCSVVHIARPPILARRPDLFARVFSAWRSVNRNTPARARCLTARASPTNRQRGSTGERLVDDAVALRQPQQGVEVIVAGVGLELEAQLDRAEADRRLLAHGEGAAEVEVAFGAHDPCLDVEPERRGHGAQRDPRAGSESFEQHVARAEAQAVTAGCRVKTCLGERAACPDRARDALAESARRPQRDQRLVRVPAVLLLQRLLYRAQLFSVHHSPRSVRRDPTASRRSRASLWFRLITSGYVPGRSPSKPSSPPRRRTLVFELFTEHLRGLIGTMRKGQRKWLSASISAQARSHRRCTTTRSSGSKRPVPAPRPAGSITSLSRPTERSRCSTSGNPRS